MFAKNLLKATPNARELHRRLQSALRDNGADSLLLSGGIDSSSIAALQPKRVVAFTTSLDEFEIKDDYGDINFSGHLAKHLRLDWHPISVNAPEALGELSKLIDITHNYDLSQLDNLAIFLAVKEAKEKFGSEMILSGEVADVLFRGYSQTYYTENEDMRAKIDKYVQLRSLPLDKMAQRLNVKIEYPYLDENVIDLAKALDKSETVAFRNIPGSYWDAAHNFASPDGAFPLGKLVLRRAMVKELPKEILLRPKTDIQFGSGMYSLSSYLESLVRKEDEKSFLESELHFQNKAHAGLYVLFRKAGNKISKNTGAIASCTWCHSATNPPTCIL